MIVPHPGVWDRTPKSAAPPQFPGLLLLLESCVLVRGAFGSILQLFFLRMPPRLYSRVLLEALDGLTQANKKHVPHPLLLSVQHRLSPSCLAVTLPEEWSRAVSLCPRHLLPPKPILTSFWPRRPTEAAQSCPQWPPCAHAEWGVTVPQRCLSSPPCWWVSSPIRISKQIRLLRISTFCRIFSLPCTY